MNKNKTFIIAIVFVLFFSIINLIWIFNYSPEINSEDMIVLGQSLRYINLKNNDYLSFKELYFSPNQPIASYLYYQSLMLFDSIHAPYFINLVFLILLSISTFFIVKIMYNEMFALLSMFIIFTTPILISYSRILYTTIMLTTLLSTSFLFYLKSKKFKLLSWSIFCALSCSIALLTYYSMLSYICSFIGISFILIFYKLKKRKLKKQLINFLIFFLLILVISVPHYLNEKNFKSLDSRSDFKEEGFLCNLFTYPALLINYHLGFIYSIILIVSLFIIINNNLRNKVNENELFILLIVGINYIFYSFFIAIKNTILTGIFIPLLIVFIPKIFTIKKNIIKILLVILLINGLVFIAPIQPNTPIHFLNKISDQIICSDQYTSFFTNDNFYYFNKKDILGKPGLLRYEKHDNNMQSIINNVHINNITNKNILDLSTNNHFELDYYTYMYDKKNFFRYSRCKDVYNKTDFITDFNFFLISNIDYTTANETCRKCFSPKEISLCDKTRHHIESNKNFELIMSVVPSNENTYKIMLYKFKV